MKRLCIIFLFLMATGVPQIAAQTGGAFLPMLTSFREAFRDPLNARCIQLYQNNLSSLPDSIDKLKNLEELYLTGNNLTSLPASITRLKKLRKLIVNNNQLCSLPHDIGKLKNLEQLYLDNNKLKSLPGSLRKLKKLRVLCFGDNEINVWPAYLNRFENLHDLGGGPNPLAVPLTAGKKGWRKLDSIFSPGKRHLVSLMKSKWVERDTITQVFYFYPIYEIRVKNLRTGKTGLLVKSNLGVGSLETFLYNFKRLTFSPDGRFLYFLSPAWERCDALHRVELATGKEEFVTDVISFKIIKSGPLRGSILAYRYMHNDGGPGEYPCLLNADGKTNRPIDNEGYDIIKRESEFMIEANQGNGED